MSDEVFSGESESMIDRMFGGKDTPHSRTEDKDTADTKPETTPEENKKLETFVPFDDGSDDEFDSDSVEGEAEDKEKGKTDDALAEADSAKKKVDAVPEKTAADYEQEIANLNKRLHDTQKAYHERSEKASALEKRIAELEKKRTSPEDDDDNWFSESDRKEVDDLKQELSEIKQENDAFDAQQQEIQQQANLATWHKDAAPVREQYPDFDELVYEKLEPMLDEENGDPRVRALYIQQTDKSPSGAYKFAKNLPYLLELLDNPDGFVGKIQSQNNNKVHEEVDRTVRGKDALRILPSAEYAEERVSASDSLVDKFFG